MLAKGNRKRRSPQTCLAAHPHRNHPAAASRQWAQKRHLLVAHSLPAVCGRLACWSRRLAAKKFLQSLPPYTPNPFKRFDLRDSARLLEQFLLPPRWPRSTTSCVNSAFYVRSHPRQIWI